MSSISHSLTPATDAYGVGTLLYRMVTGRYPVEAGSFAELQSRTLQGIRSPIRDLRPDLPGEFARVVERALNLDPSQRFQSAGAMERALAMSAGYFTHSELSPAFSAPKKRSSWAVALVALVIITIILFVAIRLLSR